MIYLSFSDVSTELSQYLLTTAPIKISEKTEIG